VLCGAHEFASKTVCGNFSDHSDLAYHAVAILCSFSRVLRQLERGPVLTSSTVLNWKCCLSWNSRSHQ